MRRKNPIEALIKAIFGAILTTYLGYAVGVVQGVMIQVVSVFSATCALLIIVIFAVEDITEKVKLAKTIAELVEDALKRLIDWLSDLFSG